MAAYSKADIERIVREVVGSLDKAQPTAKKNYTSTEFEGRRLVGIYSDMNEAIEAASARLFVQ